MRAIVGGNVINTEAWDYSDRDGRRVDMLTVWLQGSQRVNDSVTVPAALGAPQPGDIVFYIADVSVRERPRKDGGKWPAELSVWARELCENPFEARQQGAHLASVDAG